MEFVRLSRLSEFRTEPLLDAKAVEARCWREHGIGDGFEGSIARNRLQRLPDQILHGVFVLHRIGFIRYRFEGEDKVGSIQGGGRDGGANTDSYIICASDA